MKDYLGNELHEGDSVAFINVRYRNLELGTILRTNIMATIQYKDRKDWKGRPATTVRDCGQIIRLGGG